MPGRRSARTRPFDQFGSDGPAERPLPRTRTSVGDRRSGLTSRRPDADASVMDASASTSDVPSSARAEDRDPFTAGRQRRRSGDGPAGPPASGGRRRPQAAHEGGRDAPVGGQAVVEGVMMRGVRHWAVAVRKPLPEQLEDGPLPDGEAALGEIEVQVMPFDSVLKRHRWMRLPIVRGFVALLGSLKIGFKALQIAAQAQQPEDDPEISRGSWAVAILGGLALAIGLFVLTPVGLTSLIKEQLGSGLAFWMVEAVVSTTIFVGYLSLISRLPDLRRVFEYHGAEHQTISCYEAGLPLTPENASRFDRLHPRCGTSFMLIVMVTAVFVYSPLGILEWWQMMCARLVGIPLIIGISFEAIKYAGSHRGNRLVRGVMWPGMQLQRLTTRDPDHDQLAVAIAALQAVLDREDPRAATHRELVGIEVAA